MVRATTPVGPLIDTSTGWGEYSGEVGQGNIPLLQHWQLIRYAAWFDVDRVGLEAARRDYLEYRFGTVLSTSDRNYLLGGSVHLSVHVADYG